MKINKFLIILIASFCIGCAHLDKTDKILIGTAWTLAAADFYQTTRISDYPNLEESNGMIRDDKGAAIMIFGSAGIATFSAVVLPSKWRKAILGLYVGGRSAVVKNNYDLGIR